MNDRFFADDLSRASSAVPRTIDLAHAPPFAVGGIEVRPASRELMAGERRQLLEPLMMQVLVALHAANGATLSREDLIDSCWGGRAVSDDAISRVISRLRSAGKDMGGFIVETMPKIGYRLIVIGPEGRNSERTAINRRTLAAGGALALILGLLALRPRSSTEARSDKSGKLIADAQAAIREGMPDDMARAAALYQLVTEREPDNAEAWAGLSGVYRFQWEFSPPEEAGAMAARARSAARRALELDPGNGQAKATLAGLIPMFGNWTRAEAALRPVLATDPQPVRIRAGRLLADTGRLNEALALVAAAVAADPEVPRARNFHARLLQDTGRLREADQAFTAGLARWPRHLLLWFSRFYYLAFTGRPHTALEFAAERSGRPVGVPDEAFEIAFASARALASKSPGSIDTAARLHMAAAPHGAGFAENAVTFLSAVGRLDSAFKILDAYYFGRGPAISESRFGPETATYTPKFNRQCYFLFYGPSAPLRSDPRFSLLVRDIGLEAYWRESGTQPDYRRG